MRAASSGFVTNLLRLLKVSVSLVALVLMDRACFLRLWDVSISACTWTFGGVAVCVWSECEVHAGADVVLLLDGIVCVKVVLYDLPRARVCVCVEMLFGDVRVR